MARSVEISAGFNAYYSIINDLIIKAGVYAAFTPQFTSLKIGFQCNIYVYKPFLTHTESITH